MKKKQEKEIDKWSIGKDGVLPIGFGLNLAANEKARSVFSGLSEEEKQKVVDQSRQQHSKAAMEKFVSELGDSYRA